MREDLVDDDPHLVAVDGGDCCFVAVPSLHQLRQAGPDARLDLADLDVADACQQDRPVQVELHPVTGG